MESLKDLIPEMKGRNISVNLSDDDGMVMLELDGKNVLNVTAGEGKVVLLSLIQLYGRKFTKKLMKVKLNWEEC